MTRSSGPTPSARRACCAAALKKIGFDLALFGSAAADSYGGVVPSAVAELLDMPLLSFASKLDVDGSNAKIQRQAELGYNEVEAATPALVSVVKSINEPRYPSMKGIMQSKKKPIDTWSLADLGARRWNVGAGAAREKALGAEKVATRARARSTRATTARRIASSPSSPNRRCSSVFV